MRQSKDDTRCKAAFVLISDDSRKSCRKYIFLPLGMAGEASAASLNICTSQNDGKLAETEMHHNLERNFLGKQCVRPPFGRTIVLTQTGRNIAARKSRKGQILGMSIFRPEIQTVIVGERRRHQDG